MTARVPSLGLGIGWRPELAVSIARLAALGFVAFLAAAFFAISEWDSPSGRELSRPVPEGTLVWGANVISTRLIKR